MIRSLRYNWFEVWLVRQLYRLTLIVASALAALVLIAPLLLESAAGESWGQWCACFASDEMLRKTAVISALGLWVTALIFFRPRTARRWRWRSRRFVSPN